MSSAYYGGGYLRARIEFDAQQPLNLPISYNWLLQSMIYWVLGDYGRKLHSGSAELLPANSRIDDSSPTATASHRTSVSQVSEPPPVPRPYKFFTFSRLQFTNRYSVDNGRLHYKGGPLSLVVASAHVELLMSLAEGLFSSSGLVEFAGFQLHATDFRLLEHPEVGDFQPTRLKTLSPIATSSTLTTPDNKTKRFYYHPGQSEWSRKIVSNLVNKAKRLWGPDALPTAEDISHARIEPLKVSPRDLRRSYYKGTRIDAYTGLYEATLPVPLFNVAYDCGLGERNSMGFGMIEVTGEPGSGEPADGDRSRRVKRAGGGR